ncbi:pentapeptide repeat-containing protein [Gordonia jacobaea]|uniref:nSTAND1 domain-containing NTPase n=1 Tax=Gordonia jacobaea TaxID=122202 RepID=UPI003D70DBEE
MRGVRDHIDSLVGRKADARKFSRLVFNTDVVVLTGATGDGKTSLLEIDLEPALRDSGYVVLLCDDWNQGSGVSSAEDLISRQLNDDLPPGIDLRPGGASLTDQLDAYYPDECVIILDQFEELIRYQWPLYQRILRWIERTAADTRIRIVISLRIEYEHQLNGAAGLHLGPFQQARYVLDPLVSREDIDAIIESGNRPGSAPAISSEAKDALVKAWQGERKESDSSDFGLLHLQAALHALWMSKDGMLIELADVDNLRESPVRAGSLGPVYRRAVTTSVKLSLEACRRACEPDSPNGWMGIDSTLTVRAEHYVRAMSMHLSSGGFKVAHSRTELAQLVLQREIGAQLEREVSPASVAARITLADAVDSSAPRRELRKSNRRKGGLELSGSESATPIDWLQASASSLLGARSDPMSASWEATDLTAGVLMGRSADVCLVEEYRSFFFGVEWLRTCELVRVSTPDETRSMVSLVHDLFGDGLTAWAHPHQLRSQSDFRTSSFISLIRPEVAINQYSALRGERLNWHDAEGASFASEVETVISGRMHMNLRWLLCVVTAEFRNTVFINCDFRGSTFRRCRFEGVQFINCTLDDVEFLGCEIVGSLIEAPSSEELKTSKFADLKSKMKRQPSFFVDGADSSSFASLCWHNEPRIDPSREMSVYSMTAGVPAKPVQAQWDSRAILFERQRGSLMMLGGRLSSLKVRDCTFLEGGTLSLRHVAGTSVEMSEQKAVKLELFDAAIRGLTITRPIDDESDSTQGAFRITAIDSHIINTWFGVGISGSADFDDCVVWQLFNASDRDSFVVNLPSGWAHGLINVATPVRAKSVSWGADSLGDSLQKVVDTSRKVDYRSRPARFEVEG